MPETTASRNAARSRTAILEAAEELFAEHGPNGVSLAEIGERAGVSRGLPSYFFSDKETLYQNVLERAAADLRSVLAQIMEASQDRPPFEVLAKLTDCYMNYLAAHPSIVRLLQWNALENTAKNGAPWASRIPERLFDEVLASLAERMVSKSRNGADVRNSADVYDLLLSVVSVCLYPFQIRRFDPSELQRRKKHIRNLVSMLSRTEDE
jgi:TetR/AcrR family transcriptional regulator